MLPFWSWCLYEESSPISHPVSSCHIFQFLHSAVCPQCKQRVKLRKHLACFCLLKANPICSFGYQRFYIICEVIFFWSFWPHQILTYSLGQSCLHHEMTKRVNWIIVLVTPQYVIGIWALVKKASRSRNRAPVRLFLGDSIKIGGGSVKGGWTSVQCDVLYTAMWPTVNLRP